MKVTVELSKEDVKVLKDRQVFRMQWIQAGMDEKEPFDIVVQKVVNAAEQSVQSDQKRAARKPKSLSTLAASGS